MRVGAFRGGSREPVRLLWFRYRLYKYQKKKISAISYVEVRDGLAHSLGERTYITPGDERGRKIKLRNFPEGTRDECGFEAVQTEVVKSIATIKL